MIQEVRKIKTLSSVSGVRPVSVCTVNSTLHTYYEYTNSNKIVPYIVHTYCSIILRRRQSNN
jgi:hypothetical protein